MTSILKRRKRGQKNKYDEEKDIGGERQFMLLKIRLLLVKLGTYCMIHCSSPHHLHGPITIRSGGGREDRLLSTDQGRSHLSMSGRR